MSNINTLLKEAEFYRKEFGGKFGLNQKEEIVRLLYEVARRENLKLAEVYKKFETYISAEKLPLTYKNFKTFLMAYRYPSLKPEERSRVLLTRLQSASEKKYSVKNTCDFVPQKIYIEKNAQNYPLTKKILTQFPNTPFEVVKSSKDLKNPRSEWIDAFGKDTLFLSAERYDFLKKCPCSSNSLGCNYTILNLGFGCPLDCSYCYLQFYQNLPALFLYVNPDRFIEELDKFLSDSKASWRRIGTGEFTDSLALDWLTEYTKLLVPYFNDKNVFFELKTKTDRIENLLNLDHGGRTVVAWSLNPKKYQGEERGAAPLKKRLEAAGKCEEAGYPTAFHFDPIFYDANWESEYKELVDSLFNSIKMPPKWISLGTFRFHRDLKKTAERRCPGTNIFLGEQILDNQDEKLRYPERFRIDIYQKMVKWIRTKDPQVPIYLCMESPEVWKKVFGRMPFKGAIDRWIAGVN